MADVQPLRALHYDLGRAGRLDRLISPPYDVIDAACAASSRRGARTTRSRSTCRKVRTATGRGGDTRPMEAGGDPRPGCRARSLGPHADLPAPGRDGRVRNGFFCKVRISDYGPGDPPARANASGGEAGQARADAHDEGEPVADLRSLSRPAAARMGCARADTGEAPWGEVTDEEAPRIESGGWRTRR